MVFKIFWDLRRGDSRQIEIAACSDSASCAAAESLPTAFQGMAFHLLTWIFLAVSRSLPALALSASEGFLYIP